MTSPQNPAWLTGRLILVALCLTLISQIVNVITYDPGNQTTYRLGWTFPQKNASIRWFSMDQSDTLPAWFSSVLLLADAALAGAIACSAYPKRIRTVYWTALALSFGGLAADKGTHLHEFYAVIVKNWLASYWATVGALLGAVFYFSRRILPARVLFWLALGGLSLLGSYGADRFGEYFAGEHSGHHMVIGFIGDGEGLLELLGEILILHGLLVYRHRNTLNLQK